jgi:hypothetical protein
VATGAVAIPLKLPAPDFGTAEQAGPKFTAAAAADPPAADAGAEADAAGADESEPEADGDEDELHAAALRARPAASPDTARRRYFTVISLMMVIGWGAVT